MIFTVLSGFLLALAAPWICRISRQATGWLVALLPLGLTLYFATYIGAIGRGEVFVFTYAWVSGLGINFSFYLDGLSLFFSLLITGIGVLVLIYAGGYLSGHSQLGRFYLFLLMFMASMLGLVLADNLITLFVFWELTSLTSYLLIGFDHEREAARFAALQALLVTGTGGLALLAGFLLLGQAGGSLELSVLLTQSEAIRDHPLQLPILLAILAGCFTKSAQFPFHFWLPNAMEAPTPVSAYLHSSTMVKAGIYLLARLNPVLGGTSNWLYILSITGAATMLLGAYLALQHTDLKRILAYSTLSMLGTLVMLVGFGTGLAIKASLVLLFTHALYKGALFLVAGAVDHETGERNAERLGGLFSSMPVTGLAAGLAGLSMAGIPPLLGFIGKEMLFETVWKAPFFTPFMIVTVVAALLMSMLTIAVAGRVGFRPFWGKKIETSRYPHEPPISLWVGSIILAVAGLISGLFPEALAKSLFSPAVLSVFGRPQAVTLSLWHGLTPALALGIVAVAGGLGIFIGRERILKAGDFLHSLSKGGPLRWYDITINGLNSFARLQTRVLQSGYLRFYLVIIVLSAVGMVGYTLMKQGGGLYIPAGWRDFRFYEIGLAGLILAAAVVTVRSKSRLGAIAALGVVGYGVALIFVLFGAPDLAMTQFVIETLTVILFVLVFYHLPHFFDLSSRGARIRDLLVALTAGGLMTVLVLVASNIQFFPKISGYFSRSSLLLAHGRNIVNVILVDFRGIDTLGEITVLAVAGIGVYALLKLRIEKKEDT